MVGGEAASSGRKRKSNSEKVVAKMQNGSAAQLGGPHLQDGANLRFLLDLGEHWEAAGSLRSDRAGGPDGLVGPGGALPWWSEVLAGLPRKVEKEQSTAADAKMDPGEEALDDANMEPAAEDNDDTLSLFNFTAEDLDEVDESVEQEAKRIRSGSMHACEKGDQEEADEFMEEPETDNEADAPGIPAETQPPKDDDNDSGSGGSALREERPEVVCKKVCQDGEPPRPNPMPPPQAIRRTDSLTPSEFRSMLCLVVRCHLCSTKEVCCISFWPYVFQAWWIL